MGRSLPKAAIYFSYYDLACKLFTNYKSKNETVIEVYPASDRYDGSHEWVLGHRLKWDRALANANHLHVRIVRS